MSKVLKLSAETLQILKVMQTINNSMAFKASSELKTISVSGSIILESEISEELPADFNVYELNKLLSILSLPNFKDAELVFEDDQNFVTIKAGSSKIKYHFSADSFVTHPGKTLKLPKVDVTIQITQEMLDNMQKASSVLGHKVVEFRVDDKQMSLIATSDKNTDTSNDYVLELGDVDAEDFSAKIKLENLKLVPGDYIVQLLKMNERGISRWENLTRKIVSFIGIEKEA